MVAVPARREPPALESQLRALRRLALAAVHPGGATLYADLMAELCASLDVATAFVTVYTDDTGAVARTLAARLDGHDLAAFEYTIEGSPCAKVRGRAFRYVAAGVAAEFPPGTIFGTKGMDSYAAVPLVDSAGAPLGMLVVMDRRAVAGGDAEHAEAMLKIVAGRLAAEIERTRTDEVFRSTALAVSGAGSDTVFDELVRLLANLLHVEMAFVARHRAEDPDGLTILAMVQDGHLVRHERYAVAGTPCETVLGQAFRAYPRDLQQRFPEDFDARMQCTESYAGYPLAGLDGAPLGIVAVASRRPMVQVERIESTLKIFAVRVAAELERLAASEALQRSEASYRAIFEAAEDAIFIHDWDSGAIVDVNAKAAEVYGWPRDAMRRMTVADFSAGEPPYTGDDALRWFRLAKLDRCPPFEWHRRNRDGSLHWDEVRLKPALIGGRPHVLAFAHEITERKAALAALEAREAQYRAIFDTVSDGLVLWDKDLTVVDANPAALELYGYTREQVIGRGYPENLPEAHRALRLEWVRRAMAGETVQVEATARRARGDGSSFDIELRVMPFLHRGEPHALALARDITERKAALAALQSSEERYRAIFDGSVDSMVLWNGRLEVVDANAAFVRMTGLSRDEVVGRHWAERPDADDIRRLLPCIEGALAGREVHTVERVRHADGRPFDVELRYLPVRFGDEAYALGVGRDVTDRLEAERELQRSEARLRATIEAAFDGVIAMDSQGCIVEFNRAAERMLGFRREEVIGRVLGDTILPERLREPQARWLERFRASGHAPMVGRLVETTALTADGREIPVELAVSVAEVPEGSIFVGHLRDISDRQRAEQALRASEEQYRAIFNATADALILWNSRFQRVDVNEAYERLYGWSRDEVIGRGYDAPVTGEAYARPRRELVRRALAGEACSAELEAQCKDGRRILTEVHAIPFRHRGEPHVLAIARDITERRHAERRREELERQLRQAQKMEAVGQLTGGIAHDFNNILTSVIGYLVMAEERAEATADATLQRQLAQAHLAAQRARDLIARMLAFARRQRGERRPLALAPLVHQTLQLLRSTLPSTVEIDAAGVALGGGPSVNADAVQLEQVLFNLCINARDAMSGQGRIAVRLRTRDDPVGGWHCASCRARVEAGAWVELAVADSGAGMAPELLERIFDPFFSTKAPGQGSGMGLAMVHGIVHDHGGHLQVRTEPGSGAEFGVWLPLAEGMPVRAVPAPTAPGRAAPLRGRVLVVEDDPMVGDFLVERLAGWGLDVTLQRDPVAAASWLDDAGNVVDLLVTDQTMPQLTGLQLARRAHVSRPALPVVLVSGNAEAFDAADLDAGGVRVALTKPVDSVRLRGVLDELLSAHAR